MPAKRLTISPVSKAEIVNNTKRVLSSAKQAKPQGVLVNHFNILNQTSCTLVIKVKKTALPLEISHC